MIDKVEFILNTISKANIKLLERDTGIPATRMYKWRDGKGKPKTSDVDILWNYFQQLSHESHNDNYKAKVAQKEMSLDQFNDARMVNQHAGYKENSTFPKGKPPNTLMQILENIQSLHRMQDQQIELLKNEIERLNK